MVMFTVLRRVNPDYGFKLKIIAKESCKEFDDMVKNFPLIDYALLKKDQINK
jgi:hypothetical protein